MPPPGAMPIEYNLLIDPVAAQVVFNDSTIPLWQVPRDVYRQCLVSMPSCAPGRRRRACSAATCTTRSPTCARWSAHISAAPARPTRSAIPRWCCSRRCSRYSSRTRSSRYVERPTPSLGEDGRTATCPAVARCGCYTWVDTRLMFEDMYLKLAEFERWQAARGCRGSRLVTPPSDGIRARRSPARGRSSPPIPSSTT